MVKHKSIIIAIFVIVIAITIWLYSNFNPEGSDFFPKCPFLVITGLKCPGCGSQRTIHALLNGDFINAWHYNAMLVVSIPVIIVMLYGEWYRKTRPQLYIKINSQAIIISIGVLVVAWWIFRNIFNW